MSIPVVALFNNKGGVGKTSLVYHLSWMFSKLDYRVLVVDLDPQSNLTAAFLEDEELESLWERQTEAATVFGAVRPLMEGVGDVVVDWGGKIIADSLFLLPGHLALTTFEDELSQEWPRCLDGHQRSFRVISAFYRMIQGAAAKRDCEFVLVDLGPNLGAINRAALVASDHLVVPLAPDLFSLQGLKNLGPVVRRWREQWSERISKNPVDGLQLPSASIQPIGYVVMQHSERLNRPVKAYQRWAERVPSVYAEELLEDGSGPSESHLIGRVKHYRSLMPMAQEARKPMFSLTVADGAIGAHLYAVKQAYQNFEEIALEIRCRLP